MSKYEEGRATWGRDSHERHEPYEWREPTDRPGSLEADDEQHAGNGTVNHRPDDQTRADTGRDRLLAALGGGGAGSGSGEDLPGDADGTPEGLGSDELALRRMLHQAVREIEPREGSLDHLRRAVPARRARKRQAVVGVAAAALFIGTAIPALVHVSNATGSNADPSIAGQASDAEGGAGQGKGPDGGSSGSAGSAGTSRETGRGSQKGKADKGRGAVGGATGGTNPSASAQTAPPCTVAQLGQATATAGAPDSHGTVYGTFRVTNASTTSCTVSGSGDVTTATQGAADPSKITVVNHVTGDPATGLPDTAQEVTSLVLKPGASYEVRFAWVPSQTCPTTDSGTGGGAGASPDPSPTESTGTSGGGSSPASSGTAPQLMTVDGAAAGSVTVSLTPMTGSAASSTTIADACAGTVYRTGLLAGN